MPIWMLRAPSGWLRDGAYLLRWLAVVLAAACQIGASGSGPVDGQVAALSAASVFCQSTPHKGTQDLPTPHRHVPDQGIVGIAAADGQFAAILGHGPSLPAPDGMHVGEVALPGARAPPRRLVTASSPRGPPQTV